MSIDAGTPRESRDRELVLVTGGSGFIGSNLVEYLLELNYRVRVLDNLETGNIMYLDMSNPDLEFVLGDILDLNVLKKAITPDVV